MRSINLTVQTNVPGILFFNINQQLTTILAQVGEVGMRILAKIDPTTKHGMMIEKYVSREMLEVVNSPVGSAGELEVAQRALEALQTLEAAVKGK